MASPPSAVDERATEADTGLGRALRRSDGADLSARVAAARFLAVLGDDRAPIVVGRYRLVTLVGQGAMGQVWRARDDALARDVAVKLLRSSDRGAESVARLGREARALARLSHPNVVEVFDVGTVSDERVGTTVFLAMALVEGTTLRAWARAPGRTWRERLAAVLAAGEGLAAAHRIGLVHRDVKPDNILVDHTGRVRVADFGLARLAAIEPGEGGAPLELDDDEVARTLAGTLTATGTIVGTPVYMAPEQLEGGDATFATDVYALGAAAYEVFVGTPPFVGTRARIVEDKRAGAFHRPPTDDPPPPRVLDAIERALAPDPRDRPASVEALLAALRRAGGGARRRWGGALTAACAMVALVATVERDGARTCEQAAWDRDASADLRVDAKAAVALVADDRLATAVVAALTSRAGGIAAGIDAACALPEPPQADLDCWSQQAVELDAVARRIARGDLAYSDVVQLQAQLVDDEACRDAATRLRPPAALRERVAAIRSALVDARVERWSGDPAQALAAIDALVVEAEAVGWRPVHARALYERAATERSLGDGAGANEDYERAFHAATEAGDDDTALLAALELAVATTLPGALDDARAWLRHVDAIMARYAAAPHRLARRQTVAGMIAVVDADFATGEHELEIGERLCAETDCGLAEGGLGNLRAELACRRRAPTCVDRLRERAARIGRDYGLDGRMAMSAEIDVLQGLVHADRDAEARVHAELLAARVDALGEARTALAGRLALFHALALLGERRHAEAEVLARRALELTTDESASPIARGALADIATCTGDLVGAALHVDAMLTLVERRPAWESAAAHLRRAHVSLLSRRVDEAAAHLEVARAAGVGSLALNDHLLAAFGELEAKIAEARGDVEGAAAHRELARGLLADFCTSGTVSFACDLRPYCAR